MRFLAGLLGSLLTISIIAVSTSFVLDRTLLSSSYLESKAQQTNLYSDLARLLPEQIGAHGAATAAGQAQITDKLKTVITPEAIRQHVEPALTQMEQFYKAGAAAPAVINFSDLADRARAAGLDIPANQFDQQVILTPTDSPARPVIRKFEVGKNYALFAALALLIGLGFVSYRLKKFGHLLAALIIPATWFAVLAFGVTKLPGLANANFKLNDQAQPLGPTVGHLVGAISHDLSVKFLDLTIILVALALAVYGAHWFLYKRPRASQSVGKPMVTKA